LLHPDPAATLAEIGDGSRKQRGRAGDARRETVTSAAAFFNGMAANRYTEAQLRRLNEHRRTLFERREQPIVFVCECGGPGCAAGVTLTIEEYDARRPQLIVADGHSGGNTLRRLHAVPPADGC